MAAKSKQPKIPLPRSWDTRQSGILRAPVGSRLFGHPGRIEYLNLAQSMLADMADAWLEVLIETVSAGPAQRGFPKAKCDTHSFADP